MYMLPEIRSYLKKIENELVEIDRKQKKSIIEEIEGHLLEKIEQAQGSDGNELSSSEIKKMLKEFGEPEEISKEYLRQLSDEKISKRGKGKSSVKRVIFSLIAICIVATIIIAGFVYFGKDDGKKEDEKKIIIEGKGLDDIQIGDDLSKIIEVFGDPESRSETDTFIWVKYHEKNGLDFLLSKQTGTITEIRFNVGFNGNLESGLTIGSALELVLDKYDGAKKTLKTNREGLETFLFGGDKVLYEQVDGNGVTTTYKFIHDEKGILFWFGADKNVTQIVVFNPYYGIPDIAPKWLGLMQTEDMQERIIGWYGEPEEKVATDDTIWMVYHELAGIDFLISNDTKEVIEVRFNKGFDYATINQISIGSSLNDVLATSGGAKKTVTTSLNGRQNLVYGVDRVLYEQMDTDNKTTAYMFINAPEGILFWFDINKTVTQIVVFQPYSSIDIKEGFGLNYVKIGDDLDKIIDLYGIPEKREETDSTIWIVYREGAGIDFLLSKETEKIVEIRFNTGFHGSLQSGIAIGSTFDSVFIEYGSAEKTVKTNPEGVAISVFGRNKVMYEVLDGNGEISAYKFIRDDMGIVFWFGKDRNVTQIVVKTPNNEKPDIGSTWLSIIQMGDMEERIFGWYGEPEEKVATDDTIGMVYRELTGIDFLIDNKQKNYLRLDSTKDLIGQRSTRFQLVRQWMKC